uniref:Uncharacterized protein n=1 Tax=viral metagenome TaxID=1070528 RepID=A0A6C0EV95_9ZZZZ
MYKRNKSRNKKIKKSRNKKINKSRVNKSRVKKSKVGGCDECNKSSSSPSTAKLWTSGGSINEDIFNHEIDPIFYSPSI